MLPRVTLRFLRWKRRHHKGYLAHNLRTCAGTIPLARAKQFDAGMCAGALVWKHVRMKNIEIENGVPCPGAALSFVDRLTRNKIVFPSFSGKLRLSYVRMTRTRTARTRTRTRNIQAHMQWACHILRWASAHSRLVFCQYPGDADSNKEGRKEGKKERKAEIKKGKNGAHKPEPPHTLKHKRLTLLWDTFVSHSCWMVL